jgi:hypothetical protein
MVCGVMQYLEVHNFFWENRKPYIVEYVAMHFIVEYVAMHYMCPELLSRADVAV